MKLENSLSSHGGSLLSEIADLRHPEERMAARLIERLKLTPPIDVETICRGFAELSYKNFPIEIDGLCLDLKVLGKRPKVWVSRSSPPVRRRFTVAHEIGHIIIPWHTGTIIDDIDVPRSGERDRYREMEAEANRFAAELLMPSPWTIGLSERSEHVAGLMHTIHQIANVSLPAAFLKAARYGRNGFVGAEVRNGLVVRSFRTPGTHSLPPKGGVFIGDVKMPAAYEPEVIPGPDTSYFWWQIRETIDDPGKELGNWRGILNEILLEIPPEFRSKTRASVNAMIGLAIGREPKGAPVEAIYKHGLEAAQNRGGANRWVSYAVSHQNFGDYVLARSRERADYG
ncbi:ImmA/IrrE family metallo-endopeptidase [uncultured Sphingomonas sp.]|uniref:ImmA/IrrE family metallo-endopeptidase n=1 Tax=uncultured Sphingomonas sp. TaxID=158754 RepID=UPI002639B9AE|nr:ImmA/IrrE family metallo-endopeptidase [uncultured Sphingomonas sp.]